MIAVSTVGTDNQDDSAGIESLTVGSASAVVLASVPAAANTALVSVEGDATALDLTKCIRITQNGTAPTSTVGMILGNLDVYEIKTRINIANFKVIGIEAGKTNILKIEYFK